MRRPWIYSIAMADGTIIGARCVTADLRCVRDGLGRTYHLDKPATARRILAAMRRAGVRVRDVVPVGLITEADLALWFGEWAT